MQTFSASIDKIMLLNVIETDASEALDLLNIRFFIFILVGSAIPIYLISKIQIIYPNLKKQIFQKIISILISIIIVGAILIPNIKTTAQFLRNNRPLKYDLLPKIGRAHV